MTLTDDEKITLSIYAGIIEKPEKVASMMMQAGRIQPKDITLVEEIIKLALAKEPKT